MQKIIIPDFKNQFFITTLNNHKVIVDMVWLDIRESWYINIKDYETREDIISYQRILANMPLLNGIVSEYFSGDVVAISSSKSDRDLDAEAFNNDFALYYLTKDEYNEL